MAVWAAVGLHPHEASHGVAPIAALLDSAAPAPGPKGPGTVVAVGECGLDYFYEHSPKEAQREAFAGQIALAKRHGPRSSCTRETPGMTPSTSSAPAACRSGP